MTTTTSNRYAFHLADALEVTDAIVSGRDHCGGVLADRVTEYEPAFGDHYAVRVDLPSGAVMFARQHSPHSQHVTIRVCARVDGTPSLAMTEALLPLEVLARVLAEVWEADANTDPGPLSVWA